MTRQSDTLTARLAADDFAAERGLPPSGGYSGAWYRDAYLNGWWPNGWKRWWAASGLDAGAIIGDDIVAHQWTSTPIDQNVMLESEIVGSGGGGVPVTDVDQGWQNKKTRVVELAGELKAVAQQIRSAGNRKYGPVRSDVLPLADAVDKRADEILA